MGDEMRVLELLPALIMIESLVAGIVYACFGEWNKTLYWIAAALLNFSVIMMR
jgi:hypothetical protein